MIDLKDVLSDQWVEFSGGSRPDTNMLMFETGLTPKLHVKYVFDWETKEVITLSFELEIGDFDKLFNELMSSGYSAITKKDDKQELFFEWKLSEDRVMIRLEGQAYAGTEGKVRYLLSEYRDLIVD